LFSLPVEGDVVELAGKVALITGGGSGIGKATAARFIELGADVVIADVRPDGPAVAAELGADYISLDVRDVQAYVDAFAHTLATYGRLDILHLNAGVGSSPPGENLGLNGFAWVTPEAIRKVFSINYEGVINGIVTARRLSPPPADVVVTASNTAVTPLPVDPVYCSSKHAVIGFIRSTADQLATEGVRIQALCPGGTDTAMIPPDLAVGRTFSPPSYQAEGVVHALENGKPGDVWMATDEGMPYWTFTFPEVPRDPKKKNLLGASR